MVTIARSDIKSRNMKIYTKGHMLYIDSKQRDSLSVEVFNIYGSQIYETSLWNEGVHRIQLQDRPGNYLVRVQSDGQMYSQEISI